MLALTSGELRLDLVEVGRGELTEPLRELARVRLTDLLLSGCGVTGWMRRTAGDA
jgi:hypothetical protein